MDIDDDVIDLSQVRDDFDLENIKNNQNSFENLNNTTSLFQFNNIDNNNNLSFFQNGLNKSKIISTNNNSRNIQLPFNSMDDESDTEILIPLENENEELITDVQPSFSLEHGEEDATIEIELESYEKEKYSWILKSPFKNKIFSNNNISINSNNNINNTSNNNSIDNNNNNNINSNNYNSNYNTSIISSNCSLNSVDFSFSNNNNKLHIPEAFHSNSNNHLISTISNNAVNNNENTTVDFNLNEHDKKYTSENNDIENKSFLDIVENKNGLLQKEHELNILEDNNLFKTDLNLENIGSLKTGDSLDVPKDFLTTNTIKPFINSGGILKQNNKSNDYSNVNNNLEKYKFKQDINNEYSSNLNKPAFYKEKFASLNKDINNKNSIANTKNDITSKDSNGLERNINNNMTNLSNNHSETRTPDMELSFEKLHHSPPSFLSSNSNDSFSKFSNDKPSESKKINSFSNDNSSFYGENKGLKSIEKRRSLSSLNLNHFSFNNTRNAEIDKKIEEIRERLKRNEKHDNKSKGNILNDTTFHFNTKTNFEPEIKINQENLFNNDSKKINLNDDDSDEASEILNSTSFDQLEISSEKEKRPPSKKKPFSLDSIKNLNSDSFSLNLKLSSSSNSPNNTSLLHQYKRSSIPTFSQFYPNNKTNKTQKDSKKSKNSLLNIPRSESPTLEQQLSNPASTFRVAKYARLNTKLPMPSKVPRKLYDEYLNLRNDPMNNLQNVVEIKPVEPRKQAIPISKLRQPSKLRLRPNILNSSIHNNSS
ncbi:hypothetical protein U3516DRAFT_780313 [Neocallimastix sp. 'constans']|jgi:hypothetical protein